MNNENIERVQNIFRTVLGNRNLILKRDLQASEVPNWDSFNHVNIIIAVETEFGLRFPPADIANLKNVGDLLDLIDKARGTSS